MSSMGLEVNYRLEPNRPSVYIVGGTGNLRFEAGDAFSKAAMWCGMSLSAFIYGAILDRLQEVQAAMGEAMVETRAMTGDERKGTG